MNKQSAHGIKGLRTFHVNAANAISSVPVCADDDCMQCAMGLYCPNVRAPATKAHVRITCGMTSAQQRYAYASAAVAIACQREDVAMAATFAPALLTKSATEITAVFQAFSHACAVRSWSFKVQSQAIIEGGAL